MNQRVSKKKNNCIPLHVWKKKTAWKRRRISAITFYSRRGGKGLAPKFTQLRRRSVSIREKSQLSSDTIQCANAACGSESSVGGAALGSRIKSEVKCMQLRVLWLGLFIISCSIAPRCAAAESAKKEESRPPVA